MPPKGSKRKNATVDADAIAPAIRARAGTKIGLAETVRALHESGALREGIYTSVSHFRRKVETITNAHAKAII